MSSDWAKLEELKIHAINRIAKARMHIVITPIKIAATAKTRRVTKQIVFRNVSLVKSRDYLSIEIALLLLIIMGRF